MHRLGVRHVQVPPDRLVRVRPGLREGVPPERRADGLLPGDAVRGADLGGAQRPIRPETRPHRHDHAPLHLRVRVPC